MNDNLELWKSTCSVPVSAKTKITGGRMNGKTNIRPQWRLMVLTEQFGPCGVGWYYQTKEKWLDAPDGLGTVSAHVIINLFIKDVDHWSSPIEGQGGSMLVAAEKAGPYHSDEAYKMATTDALSVACKQLGIGADVYMDQDSSKYIKTTNSQTDKYEEHLRGCQSMEELSNTWSEIYKKLGKDDRETLGAVKDEMKAKL